MINLRLDEAVVQAGLADTRSHAMRLIKLGQVRLSGRVIMKPAQSVNAQDLTNISLVGSEQYVSRAGFKLASVAQKLHLDFRGKIVLDVGSSTGGFTDYALRHGAVKVIAVDSGTEQLHPTLRTNQRIELHEQTDIRQYALDNNHTEIDLVLIDVSFISLREILPSVASLCSSQTKIVAMCKPQFEVGSALKHKGVIKNDHMRREILQQFESWLRQYNFYTIDKADSEVAGEKGNVERFYLLKLT